MGINQLIFLMMKCLVLFKVRVEFLNAIKTSIDFKGLKGLRKNAHRLSFVYGTKSVSCFWEGEMLELFWSE